MKAGFTSKNHFDTLGLFGMGFNIATGKLGRVTRVISARREDDYAIEVVLDLPKLIQDRSFSVTAERSTKPHGLEHGTVIEIRGWWPSGDANSGFIRELARIPKKALRERLGRRYATLLRGDHAEPVHISLNGERCQPFEHCAWSAERFVTRKDHGEIPARIDFDEVIDRSRRCLKDGAEFGGGEHCPRCNSSESRELIHRIKGWVGIQRFDHQDDFGIDLIRNGRAIRIAEKAAFFEHIDETTGKPEREYPIDQQYGRIVGEVHLDQVPVDFQKQNFQQATPEWQAAMKFLRGGSLLPSKWDSPDPNNTPISLLFQGYRKVRNIGRGDLYMGQYSDAKGKAVRVSRELERDYHQRFLNHEPGYYDDAKWWELVETATEPPIPVLPECPECGFQNSRDAEVCDGCDHVLASKPCRNTQCGKSIQRSAVSCQYCGESQIVKIEMPWVCAYCNSANAAGDERCPVCGSVKGSPHPASPNALKPVSEDQPELGVSRLSITLSNGKATDPLDIDVRSVVHPIYAAYGYDPVPLVTDSKPGRLTVFVDLNHMAFTALGLRPEYLIASQAAQYLHALHANLLGSPGHTIASLTSELLKEGWGDSITENPDTVGSQIKELFNRITEKAVTVSRSEDFYDELDQFQQQAMAESMIKSGVDLSELSRLKSSGGFLRYCDRETIASFFGRHPQGWFNSTVWSDEWPEESGVGPVVADKLREELRLKYLRCLEDCASYLRYERPERLFVVRASAAAEFLYDKLS